MAAAAKTEKRERERENVLKWQGNKGECVWGMHMAESE